jgi:UDP-2,3-diacylglucosamine pyrophosphatase LpxH
MSRRHLYVISDLHLGGAPEQDGRPGFQMCPPEARRRLARFLRHVLREAERATAGDSTELVINGDLVDFLAEKKFQAFTRPSEDAVAKLGAIIKSTDAGAPEGEQVFPALREFVQKSHRLTVLLGNHDIELRLPKVRRALADYLTDGKAARLEFLFDGEAYVQGSLLVEHGNRYDAWNAVAHGALRAYCATISRGEPAFEFTPPPGSRLVAEIMNPLKARYRFIDLLKPENEALLPILLALEPATVKQLRGLMPQAYRAARAPVSGGRVPEAESHVANKPPAVAGPAGTPARAEDLEGLVVPERSAALTQEEIDQGEAVFLEMLATLAGRVSEEEAQVGDGLRPWLQSAFSLWKMRGAGPRRYQHLRDALAAHRRAIGATFDLQDRDPIYCQAAERLAAGRPRVIVFGHTHLPRFVRLDGGGVYLNTGTWCPTIRLPDNLYAAGANDDVAEKHLRQFVEDLGANRLAPWTCLRTLFAYAVVAADGTTTAKLCEYLDDGRVIDVGEWP